MEIIAFDLDKWENGNLWECFWGFIKRKSDLSKLLGIGLYDWHLT